MRIAVGVVLARILTRAEFGFAAMAIVVSAFIAIFTGLSLGSALVQRDELTEADRSTAFWTSLAFGAVFTLGGVALSGEVADFFGHDQVAPLFAVLSIGFTLTALAATQQALLTRDLAFRSLQLRELAATFAGGAAAVVLAVAGTGAWAIIGQQLGAGAMSVILLWSASPWRPRLLYSWASLRDLGSFGAKLFSGSLLSYFSLNGDNLLIGRFLGATALGTYSLAYNLMFMPMWRLAMPIHQVAFPAYARLRSDTARLRSSWLRGKRISSLVLAPAFLGLLAIAPDVVPAVFGSKWHAAVPVLELLCLAGLSQAVGTLNWTVLMALGEGGLFLRLNVLETVVTVAAFGAGLPWGIVGVAGFYAASKWPLALIDTHFAARAVGVSTRDALWAGSHPALPLALAMAGAVYGTRLLLEHAGVAQLPRLLVVVALGAVVYVGLWRVLLPRLYTEVRELLPQRTLSVS
jgi:O-antigen/teichoic acid export membrane protein